MTLLDRADLRRWKHTLDYHKDKEGKERVDNCMIARAVVQGNALGWSANYDNEDM